MQNHESDKDRRSQLLSQLLVVWLFIAFCGTLYLNFAKPGQVPGETPQIDRLAERLVVVARYTPELSPELSEQFISLALELEADEGAKAIIRSQHIESLDLEKLTPVYRLLAASLKSSDEETTRQLERLATEGRHRFFLSISLLSSIFVFAVVTLFISRTEDRSPPSNSDLSAVGILSVFFAWHVLGMVGVGILSGLIGPSLDPFFKIMLAQVLTYAWMLILLSQMRSKTATSPFRRFRWSWVGKGYFLSLVAVLTVNTIVSALSGEPPRSENIILTFFVDAPVWKYAMLGLLVVFLGPIFEEIMFRGWLFGGLRQTWGDGPAFFVSSALFAVIHGDAPALPALFCLGLIFAWVYRRSGSLYSSMLVHGMWNATTFSLLLSVMP